MKRRETVLMGAAVLVAAGLLVRSQTGSSGSCCSNVGAVVAAAEAANPVATNVVVKAKVPRLVDLGAGKCIPCKMMAPILEELKKEYAGRMEVEFIDVWNKPEEGKAYGIQMIPTQIFYDATGKELFRHEGFFSKEDILAKWGKLGVSFGSPKSKVEGPKSEAGGEARK